MNPFYNNAIAQKAIHIVKSLEKPQRKPKLVIKYVLINTEKRKENKARKHNRVASPASKH